MPATAPPPAPEEIRVRLPKQLGALLGGAAVCLPLGALTAFSPWFPREWIDEPAPLGVLITGWFLLLLGLAMVLALGPVARARWFSISPAGLAYVDPKMPKEEWRFAWHELALVELRVARVAVARRGLVGLLRAAPHRVRLVLMPMSVAALEPYRALRTSHGAAGPGTAMAALGDAPRVVPELDAALRRFGGAKYRGVLDEGEVLEPL